MNEPTFQQGFAVLCSPQGKVFEVMRDTIGLDWLKPDQSITPFIDPGSRKKYLSFLADINANRATYDWEINISDKSEIKALRFAGVLTNEKLLIVAARNASEALKLFEEMIKINNEQTNSLRTEIKNQSDESIVESEPDEEIYIRLMKMNNELVSLQRDLAKKNFELEVLYEKVQKLSVTDQLTGLLNRRGFYEVARSEAQRVKRYKHPLSVIMFDLDHFKSINDTYGHFIGDFVLEKLAARYRSIVRKSDVLSRFGGEEFIILLPETDLKGAEILAERIRKDTRKPIDIEEKTVIVSVSLGVAEFTSDMQGLEPLFRNADHALYEAKDAGRDRTIVFRKS